MTTLPRIATAGELAKIRSDNQSSRMYLSIHSPATVYTARLAAVPTSTDKVAEITYNTGSGTLANVLQDMTLLVGSTAGASDVGIARIRKDGTTTAGTFYIGETSEINWTSNAYLTVLDSFELWPRHVRISPSDGTTPLMDYDVAYTDQNQAAGSIPTPIMGSHAVLWLNGASVTYSPDASDSWVNGGTITDYLWTCSTADSITDDDTATPTFVFDTAGTHRIALTVTGDNAVTFTGYRYVFVVTESSGVTTQFTLDSCAGDYDAGGWTYRVTLYDEATQALIRDRALCVLHSVDYYGDTLGSVGYVAGAENVVAVGWIAGESIVWASEDKAGSVSFDVQGPQYWLWQMTAFPSGVKDVSDATTPNKWTKFRGLTLNKAWYHFMRWRCTATRCLDVYPIDDTRRIKRLESPGGQNIWAQLTEISKRSILAEPCSDRYGRLFLQINQQYVSDRSGMPTVQAITSADWRGEITLDRAIVDATSLVDLSGVAWDGLTSQSYFSLAPGHVFNHYGTVEVVDRLALIDQSTSNTLAGLYSARQNNAYQKIDLQLGANHRLIDIAPYQRVTLAVSSGDTVRGITEALTLIPRGVSYGYQDGYVLTDVICEAEVTAALAVTGDTPPDPPDPPVLPIDPPIDPPPIDPILPSDADEVWLKYNDGNIYYSTDFSFSGLSQPSYTAVAVGGGIIDDAKMYADVTGLTVYIFGYLVATNVYHIWKTTTADVKAGSPTWTSILTGGDSLGTGTWTANYNTTEIDMRGESLYGIFTGSDGQYHGEYNGSWVFTKLTGQAGAGTPGYRAYGTWNSTTFKGITYTIPGTTLYDFGIDIIASQSNIFSNIGRESGRFMGVYNDATAYKFKLLVNATSGALIYTWDEGVGKTDFTHNIGGSVYGTTITIVDDQFRLIYSADGINFSPIATWEYGFIKQANSTGGSNMVWALLTVASNNVPIRTYTPAGAAVDMTGNFWTVASGDLSLSGFQLVFKP